MDVDALWDELERSLVALLQGYRKQLQRLVVRDKPDATLLSEADVAAQEKSGK